MNQYNTQESGKRPDIKVIIAGGRDYDDYEMAKAELNMLIAPGVFNRKVTIVSGRCSVGKLTFTTKEGTKVYGADGIGERYAQEYGFEVEPYPADWSKGKKAGYIRNLQMAKAATHAIIFWDGKSKGSEMMIKLSKENGLRTVTINY